MILEYSSGAAQQKADDYDADERASGRSRDKPCVKLEDNDKNEHSDNCQATAAKNKQRENAGNGSDNNAERNSDRRDKRRMLKRLLVDVVAVQEAACAGSVVEEVLNESEQCAKQGDGCIRHRRIACMWNTLVGVVEE